MKKVISLVVLLCAFAGSALASAPEAALKALNLGNEKFVLEQSLSDAPLAVVIADEAITQEPAALFGLDAGKVATIRVPFGPEAGISAQAKDLVAPMVLILGTDEEMIWTVYANTVKASPELIHAVLKGQVVAQGALLDAETGEVKLLGAHPDQQVLVGRYLLGASEASGEAVEVEAHEEAAVEPAAETHAEPAAEVHEATAETHEEAAVEAHGEAADAHAAPADAHMEAESGGGMSFTMLILFVIALVGVVAFLDKVVLKD
jgi:hypothetical protein